MSSAECRQRYFYVPESGAKTVADVPDGLVQVSGDNWWRLYPDRLEVAGMSEKSSLHWMPFAFRLRVLVIADSHVAFGFGQ